MEIGLLQLKSGKLTVLLILIEWPHHYLIFKWYLLLFLCLFWFIGSPLALTFDLSLRQFLPIDLLIPLHASISDY